MKTALVLIGAVIAASGSFGKGDGPSAPPRGGSFAKGRPLAPKHGGFKVPSSRPKAPKKVQPNDISSKGNTDPSGNEGAKELAAVRKP